MTEKVLAKYVDDSAFSLAEWEQAIEVVRDWLVQKERESQLETILGFIACSAEIAGKHPGIQFLPTMVEDMLRHHGFDG